MASQDGNCKVYISNINKTCEERDILDKFSEYGKIKSLILKKKENNVTYSFIEFERPEFAQAAITHMDKQKFFDRFLKVQHGVGGRKGEEHYNDRKNYREPPQNHKRHRSYSSRSRRSYSSSSSRDQISRDYPSRDHPSRDHPSRDHRYRRERSRTPESRRPSKFHREDHYEQRRERVYGNQRRSRSRDRYDQSRRDSYEPSNHKYDDRGKPQKRQYYDDERRSDYQTDRKGRPRRQYEDQDHKEKYGRIPHREQYYRPKKDSREQYQSSRDNLPDKPRYKEPRRDLSSEEEPLRKNQSFLPEKNGKHQREDYR